MRNQSFSKIWIVIILVILIGGGIFAWQYFRVSEEKIVPGEEVIEDETIDWKEYTSDIFKILLKYPSDFNLIEDNTSGVIDRAFEIKKDNGPRGHRYHTREYTRNAGLSEFFVECDKKAVCFDMPWIF